MLRWVEGRPPCGFYFPGTWRTSQRDLQPEKDSEKILEIAANQRVVGSSPTGGADLQLVTEILVASCLFFKVFQSPTHAVLVPSGQRVLDSGLP
jgi:hypothetical protein